MRKPDLCGNTPGERLEALRQALPTLSFPPLGRDVNNHIHTTYSFSPYSPTAAAWKARASGLCTAGIVDHDTIRGAWEFLAACDLLGLGGTCGLECRASFDGTPLAGRRINNPDQAGVAYILLHAVPHWKIEAVDGYFAPLREKRNLRNRAMVARMNSLLEPFGLTLDFDRDVLPLSQWADGGAVTERHLASALAHALQRRAARGEPLLRFLADILGRPVGDKYAGLFLAPDNPFFHYDLIGWIKAELVPLFFLDADEECAPVQDVLALAEEAGAISAYAYLGDVTDSVTGDKRPQAFEDAFLDELFEVIGELGFRAVTYMPSRNTPAQIQALRRKIRQGGFLEISGEDINQPRQNFVCMAMRGPDFDPLRDSAWALVAHERETDGLFSPETIRRYPSLPGRVKAFAEKGRETVAGG